MSKTTADKLRDREDWLLQLRDEVAPWYEAQGWELPSVRIGVGFPSTGRKSKRIGECWMAEASEDKHSEIFIHPGYADSVDVAGTVVHELIHAAVNADGKNKKHGPVFKKVALAIGLAGPMRATHVGPELAKKLDDIIKRIGKYPHAKLNTEGMSSHGPKQKNRMLKASCPECQYIIRASKACFEIGVPPCPNDGCSLSYKQNEHIIEMIAEMPDGEEGD
jgi:hypothetical protein